MLRCNDHTSYRGERAPGRGCETCSRIYSNLHPVFDGKERARIVLLDIENHDLNADYGWFICGSWKLLDDPKMHTVSILDFPKYHNRASKSFDPNYDKEAVGEYIRQISNADIMIGHYAIWHDLPYLNTRALIHGLPTFPPDVPLQDTWSIARKKMKLGSNRLASIERALKISFNKTSIQPEIWRKASWGDKPSLKYIIDHCELDVHVLEEAYKKLRTLSTSHPNVCLPGAVDGCPKCGVVGHLERRGRGITKTGMRQRYQCRACGSWSSTSIKRVKECTLQ
jgi:hypothetical protein